MARLWPAGGRAPTRLKISRERFLELQELLGVTFTKRQKSELLALCDQYLNWEDLQDAAEGSPAVAKKWLKQVHTLGAKLRAALETGTDHSKQVAATTLRAEMNMNFEVFRRGLGELTWAAQRVLKDITSQTKIEGLMKTTL